MDAAIGAAGMKEQDIMAKFKAAMHYTESKWNVFNENDRRVASVTVDDKTCALRFDYLEPQFAFYQDEMAAAVNSARMSVD